MKGVKPEHLDLLSGCVANVRIPKNEFLFEIEKSADQFFLIRQGRLRLELPLNPKRSIVIQTAEENDIVGWSWMIPPYRWHFSGRALDDIVALSFDAKCIRKKFSQDHELCSELCIRFSTLVAKRLEETLLQMAHICD